MEARDGEGRTPLHHAAEDGRNAADKNGMTPLYKAAGTDDVNLVRLLLSHKANANARDKKRRTPRGVAVTLENERVAEVLRRITKKE